MKKNNNIRPIQINSQPRKIIFNSVNKGNNNIKNSKRIIKTQGNKIHFKNSNAIKSKKNNQKKIIKPINNNKNKIDYYNIFELNSFKYQLAKSIDKRSFCDYYISLIKTKHPIFFSFCPAKDYNSQIIKFCLFMISFSIYYSINYSFFSEEMIHKIYEEGGDYNINYFIPKISIAFAISHIISIIIKYIFLSERNIIEIKRQPTLIAADNIISKVKKNIIIKYTIFFISGFLFLGFLWILLSSFGAVYQNTQIFVLKNTLISFAMSIIYPFIFNVIPCSIRFLSLNSKNECLYNFSKFLQLL